MALSQDIEKAFTAMVKYCTDVECYDTWLGCGKDMKEHAALSRDMVKLLQALDKEVTKDQKELTKEQQRDMEACFKVWTKTDLYGQWTSMARYCDTFLADFRKVEETMKRVT